MERPRSCTSGIHLVMLRPRSLARISTVLTKPTPYPLGSVFLHILAVIYVPNHRLWDGQPTMHRPRNRKVSREKHVRKHLNLIPPRTPETAVKTLPVPSVRTSAIHWTSSIHAQIGPLPPAKNFISRQKSEEALSRR